MAANPDALSREALRAMWADAKAMWKSKNLWVARPGTHTRVSQLLLWG